MSDESIRKRPFPLIADREKCGPLAIPWSVAEKAYGIYAGRYGRSQSLEDLARRGGFGVTEMDLFYPPWRDEVSEINQLRAELTRLRSEMASLGTRQPDHFSVTADGVLWGGTDYDDIDDAKHHAEQFMKDEYRNVEVVRVVTFIQPLEIP